MPVQELKVLDYSFLEIADVSGKLCSSGPTTILCNEGSAHIKRRAHLRPPASYMQS